MGHVTGSGNVPAEYKLNDYRLRNAIIVSKWYQLLAPKVERIQKSYVSMGNTVKTVINGH